MKRVIVVAALVVLWFGAMVGASYLGTWIRSEAEQSWCNK